jgi:hypothetical protein
VVILTDVSSLVQACCDWTETISAETYLIPSASFAIVFFKNFLPIVTKSHARVVQAVFSEQRSRMLVLYNLLWKLT